MKLLALLILIAPAAAAAAQEANPTRVPQLAEPAERPSETATTAQLNAAVATAFEAGRVDQLDLGEGGVIVFQAEGGVDRCDPAAGRALSEFCRDLLARRAGTGIARTRTAPETDLATASPGNIDRFSTDPAATADQIGRGQPDSYAAQAMGGDMLGREPEGPAPEEQLLPPGLSPEFLDGPTGVPPIVAQGE